MPKLLALLLILMSVNMTSRADPRGQWRDPLSGIAFTRIEAGCFQMGVDQASPQVKGERPFPPRDDEVPRHRVCLDPYWIGTFEVTVEQWRRVLGETGTASQPMSHPVGNVTWEDAQRFVASLNDLHRDRGGYHFRLPTEAEWEYACWAGENQTIVTEHSEVQLARLMKNAWFGRPMRPNATSRSVGELAPNAWGLYDMLGNVWEWTADTYRQDGYSLHAADNPRVNLGDDRHVIRGGGYNSDNSRVRCGARNYGLPSDPLPTVGLRVVRE